MDGNKAHSIVSALANGVNPLNGEVFASDSPYQSTEIVRALFLAAQALEASNNSASSPPAARAMRARGDAPPNAGKPWNDEEDRRLLAEFDRGRSPAELATAHGRTIAGIQSRLEKHGRLQPQSGGKPYARLQDQGRTGSTRAS